LQHVQSTRSCFGIVSRREHKQRGEKDCIWKAVHGPSAYKTWHNKNWKYRDSNQPLSRSSVPPPTQNVRSNTHHYCEQEGGPSRSSRCTARQQRREGEPKIRAVGYVDRQATRCRCKIGAEIDIEGCNTLDIVFARQENDAIRRKYCAQLKTYNTLT
jgi:hypothetical protein